MSYFLGLDAGGTKTYCLVADHEGHVLGFGRAGAGNYEVNGVEAAAIENRAAVEQALSEAGLTLADIAAIGMGIAGADIPEDYEMLERTIFTPLFGTIPRVFRNDSMAGLRGGVPQPYGIVIACGTGCVCAGRSRDAKEARIGGINEDFGDQVSGESIGDEGLRNVWRARDGLIPPTLLTERFLSRAGCADVEEFFLRMYRGEITREQLQPMAPVVFDAALDGDTAACDILEWAGRYLGQMVNACARRLAMSRQSFDVVMTGSVFKGSSPVLIDAMATVIHRECPNARLVCAALEPVAGALLLGMEMDAPVSDAVYSRLQAELGAAEMKYKVALRLAST